MRYCPNCETEYMESIKQCPECNVETLDEQSWQKVLVVEDELRQQTGEFKIVKVCDDQFYAEMIKDVLENEGIPLIIRQYKDTAYAGIFEQQLGWGAILVPKQFLKKTEKLIEELDQASKEQTIFEDEKDEDENESDNSEPDESSN